MTKSQFKLAYSSYRKRANDLPENEGQDSGLSSTSLEWLADSTSDEVLDVVRPCKDVLAARAANYQFASVTNRHGQYGWQNADYTL